MSIKYWNIVLSRNVNFAWKNTHTKLGHAHPPDYHVFVINVGDKLLFMHILCFTTSLWIRGINKIKFPNVVSVNKYKIHWAHLNYFFTHDLRILIMFFLINVSYTNVGIRDAYIRLPSSMINVWKISDNHGLTKYGRKCVNNLGYETWNHSVWFDTRLQYFFDF